MAGVVHVDWYATVLRQDALAAEVAAAAPLALRYGATQYSVHISRDDRYKITLMVWFESKPEWYSFWEGPEMVEFRARHMGRYQIPINYVWHDEVVAGSIGPAVSTEPEPEPVAPGPPALA
jgi:hypothetical protein